MRTPADMWARQEKRADLALRYWDLAGGRPGARVADVGCGPGYFSARYAALTGPTGRVHAVDEDQDSLDYLQTRLDPVHAAHVTLERLDITRAPLPDLHFHAIFCTDMLHHVADVRAALRNLHMKGARLVLSEFDPEGPGAYGPDLGARIAPSELSRALRETGWEPAPHVALPHEHYAIVASVR